MYAIANGKISANPFFDVHVDEPIKNTGGLPAINIPVPPMSDQKCRTKRESVISLADLTP